MIVEPGSPTLARKILQFPLIRLAIALIVVATPAFLARSLLTLLGNSLFKTDEPPLLWTILAMVMGTGVAVVTYLGFVRIVEKR